MASFKKEFNHYDILSGRYPLPLTEAKSGTKETILMEATILFAKNGYAAVSMRELADSIGIKQASLYNHFSSKEALWAEVLDHALDLYILYFQELDKALKEAGSFEEVLEVLFTETKKLRNLFTCYAFGLVQTEQFRDRRAAEIFDGTFLEYSIKFIQDAFDRSIEKGWAKPFDSKTVATVFMHSVLIGLNVKVQETLGRPVPYDPSEMFADVERLLRDIGAQGLGAGRD